MPDFRVFWEIDAVADTPEEAARWAFEQMQRPGTSANVFDVIDARGQIHRIDLEELDQEHDDDCPAKDGFGCRCGEGEGGNAQV